MSSLRCLSLLALWLWAFAPALAEESHSELPQRIPTITAAEHRAVQFLLDSCQGEVDSQGFEQAELQARIGPACLGSWQLLTAQEEALNRAVFHVEWQSGLDDVLTFDFDEELRLERVTSLGEPSETSTPTETASVFEVGGPPSDVLVKRWGVLAVALLLLMITCICRRLTQRLVFPRVAMAGLFVLLLVGCFGSQEGETQAADSSSSNVTAQVRDAELRALVDLRAALVRKETDPTSLEHFPKSFQVPEYELMRTSYLTQWQLATGAKSPADLLAELGSSTGSLPTLALGLSRARAQVRLRQGHEALISYRVLLEQMPFADSLYLEAALALDTLSVDPGPERLIRDAVERGSRIGDVYFEAAQSELLDGDLVAAEGHFMTGFQLAPRSRTEILESGLLSYMVEPSRPIHAMLAFDQVKEPAIERQRLSDKTLRLPRGTRAAREGELLYLAAGDLEVAVHGGAALASDEVALAGAGAWRDQQAKAAVGRLSHRSGAADHSAVSGLQTQEALYSAVQYLSRRSRWRELVRLTDGIEDHVGKSGNVKPELAQLRVQALDQLGENRRAARLMATLIKDIVERDRYDPGTLITLSNVLATSHDRHDIAIKLLRKANHQFGEPIADSRIQQLKLEARLREKFEVHESEHFKVLYPPGRSRLVERMAQVLEAEFQRLGQFIPVELDKRIEVHIMAFDEFSDLYGGRVEVMGIYDGRIRVPLADSWEFHPFLVSLLTHELAHAMIAELTGNQAPKWVHEGIAQMVEMEELRTNPMEDYQRSGRLLSLPMIEAVLRGFPNEALVAAAYDEALWTFFYIQKVHGTKAIHRLLFELRDGAPWEQAIEVALGKTTPQLDAAMKQWWLGKAPDVWLAKVHQYDTYTDPHFVRRGEKAGYKLDTEWWRSQ